MKLKSLLIPAAALLVVAGILFGVSAGLASVREKNEAADLDYKLHTLLPGSKSFTEEAYTGADSNIKTTYKGDNGFVVHTRVEGYAGPLEMLVGVSDKGRVTGLVVRQSEETYGLGAQAMTDWQFLSQFLNTEGKAEVGSDIDALTGATVTSKAVTRSVNSAVAFVTGADIDSGATAWEG